MFPFITLTFLVKYKQNFLLHGFSYSNDQLDKIIVQISFTQLFLYVCLLAEIFYIIYLFMLAVKLAIRHSCHSIVAVWAHVWLSFFNLSSVLICLSGSSIVMMSIHKSLLQDTHWKQHKMYIFLCCKSYHNSVR